MFDILAYPQSLAREAELFLDGFIGSNEASRMVGSIEIPCVKAREVLKGSEEFIAADCEVCRVSG